LSVAQAAAKANVGEWEMFFELVKADVNVSPESMNEAQKHLALQTPWVMIETDSPAANPETIDTTHPRAFGAFPRVIAKYVREDGIISLEDAISRMTSLPARRVGMPDRGVIAVDMAADLLIFDPAEFRDTATFAKPMQYAHGIEYLLVNGVLVIDNSRKTDARPGQVLRYQAPSR
jgi:N-acyl-D-aspartate/D-glutamate deacylase